MKPATTWEQQKDKLKSRGLQFDNDEQCVEFLSSVNYYRLSAYLLPFKIVDPIEHYEPDVTLDQIMVIYDFDKELRTILFAIIEEIEIYVRTQIAYYVAHKIDPLAYLDRDIFIPSHDHDKFIELLKASVRSHEHTPIVQKYVKERTFPIWVLIEFFSIGMLSRFYGNLKSEHQKGISKALFKTNVPPKVVKNWLICITNLRNRCAHYERLYYSNFYDIPILPNKQPYTYGNKLFGQMIVLKNIHKDRMRWVNYINRIDDLIRHCGDCIDLEHIGFPDNWKDVLVSGIRMLATATT